MEIVNAKCRKRNAEEVSKSDRAEFVHRKSTTRYRHTGNS
jgi:hypothetical protein